jgi:hypothetical protein
MLIMGLSLLYIIKKKREREKEREIERDKG